MGKARNNLKTVLSVRKYALICIGVALLFYILNIIFQDWVSFQSVLHEEGIVGTLPHLRSLMIWYQHSGSLIDVLLLDSTSLLLGVLTALIIYKMHVFSEKRLHQKSSTLGGLGFFLAVFTSSCLPCGIGIFSVLGIGAATLSFLPYDGKELPIIAIIVLILAIRTISKDLYACRIKK